MSTYFLILAVDSKTGKMQAFLTTYQR